MASEPERRDFVRVATDIPVRYRFRLGEDTAQEVFGGTTTNLSGGGLLLHGRLPGISAVTQLLTQRATLELEMTLPGDPHVIRATARCAWIESIDEATLMCHYGLRFAEIAAEDKDRIFRFVIRVQIPL
jgi:c-di-GMP-binding flagellar brake protein YcgR